MIPARVTQVALPAILVPLALVGCLHASDDQDEAAGMPPAIPNQLQDEKIAFVDDPGGDGLIAAVDPDGSGKERLMTVGTRVPPWPESLAISPDGHRVAFVGILRREDPTATTRDLYVIDSDGGNERRLTRNTTEELAVDWLPDGRIVFVSCPTTEYRDELPECDLVAMRPDGSDREELSKLRLTFDIDVSPDGRRSCTRSRRANRTFSTSSSTSPTSTGATIAS